MSEHPKTVVLGISGSIAAYKTPELIRLYKKAGYRVIPVLTEAGRRFVTTWTLRSVSGEAPIVGLFEKKFLNQPVRHIALAEEADLIVIAPATANIIAKISRGVADDFLSTLVLSARSPVVLAPAMNIRMWRNKITQKNVAQLRRVGFHFIGPAQGNLACGAKGTGRMAPVKEIFQKSRELLQRTIDFKNKKILVTAGATREYLDPVRFISNAASGKMGFALAVAAASRGARVTLITGPSNLEITDNIKKVSVASTDEMAAAVKKLFPKNDILIMAAAPADFTPAREKQKIKKGKNTLVVKFKKTPDILKNISYHKKTGQVLVGFSLETENLKKNALAKLRQKKLDIIVANQPVAGKTGFESETNQVYLFHRGGRQEKTALLPKEKIAHLILDFIKKYHG